MRKMRLSLLDCTLYKCLLSCRAKRPLCKLELDVALRKEILTFLVLARWNQPAPPTSHPLRQICPHGDDKPSTGRIPFAGVWMLINARESPWEGALVPSHWYLLDTECMPAQARTLNVQAQVCDFFSVPEALNRFDLCISSMTEAFSPEGSRNQTQLGRLFLVCWAAWLWLFAQVLVPCDHGRLNAVFGWQYELIDHHRQK